MTPRHLLHPEYRAQQETVPRDPDEVATWRGRRVPVLDELTTDVPQARAARGLKRNRGLASIRGASDLYCTEHQFRRVGLLDAVDEDGELERHGRTALHDILIAARRTDGWGKAAR